MSKRQIGFGADLSLRELEDALRALVAIFGPPAGLRAHGGETVVEFHPNPEASALRSKLKLRTDSPTGGRVFAQGTAWVGGHIVHLYACGDPTTDPW